MDAEIDAGDELAGEVEPREELRAMIVATFVALLRSGTITWRAARLAGELAALTRA